MDVVLEFMQKEIGERGLDTAPAVPVAVLLGARSRPAPPGVTLPVDWAGLRAAELAQRVRKMGAWVLDAPDGLFAVARHAGHFVHQDDAELVVDAIRRVVFPDVGWQLASTLSDGGATALAETYGTLKRRYPADRFHENLLNTLGYDLLRAGRVEDAIAVFELNVEEYPAAWNPHDSLGDAYRAAGRMEDAMASYRRSLELNPNSPSRRKLETLEPGG
jgi:tetratricopeptide (TPR) repeat protein